jgi:hypothetical protein
MTVLRAFLRHRAGFVATVATTVLAFVGPALAEPVPPLYDGKTTTYEILPGSILRTGDSFTSSVVATLLRGGTVQGSGTCTQTVCPVTYEGKSAFARRSRLRLPGKMAGVGGGPGADKHDRAERKLRRGDQGEAVMHLQEALNKNGAKLVVDKNFGRGTREAVTNFQKSKSLKADGVAGRETLRALGL